jgi:uncharacterized RDD family membrane protein YckC
MTHDVERVDVSMLSETQRDMLWMRLRADDVMYVFDGDGVAVPAASGPLLTEAMSWVNTNVQSPPARFYAQPHPFQRTLDNGSVIASPWRRAIGAYIDGVVIGIPFAAALRLGLSGWLLLPISAVYVVTMTTILGRTVGKFATGTRVVRAVDRGWVTWRQSLGRWAHVGWIGIAAGLVGGTASLLLFGLQAVTYAPILWDSNGRGLHDRAAGTLVVRGVR